MVLVGLLAGGGMGFLFVGLVFRGVSGVVLGVMNMLGCLVGVHLGLLA